MNQQKAALLGGLALLVATATGCGSEPGPSAAPSIATSGAPAQAANPAATLTRDEADPCRLLNEKQAAQLGVGDGTLARSNEALHGQACRLTNFPNKPVTTQTKNYLIQLLDNPGALATTDNTATRIQELPTKRGTPSGATPDNTCVDIIDLTPTSTPDRYLWVQFADLARDNPSLNHQIACSDADTAANAALTSLNQTSG